MIPLCLCPAPAPPLPGGPWGSLPRLTCFTHMAKQIAAQSYTDASKPKTAHSLQTYSRANGRAYLLPRFHLGASRVPPRIHATGVRMRPRIPGPNRGSRGRAERLTL